MAIIEFETGQTVEFDGTPSQQDIEEVAKKLNIQKESKPLSLVEKGFPFLGLARKSLEAKERQIASGEVGLKGPGKILPTMFTGQTPKRGERTFLGNIFERPGAASRSAIRAQPALAATGPLAGIVGLTGIAGRKAKEASRQGALFPEEVETFQQEAIRKSQIAPRADINVLLGTLPSAMGLATDILTNPGDVVTILAGKTPVGKGVTLEQKIAGTRLGQNVNTFLNKERTLTKSAKTAKESFRLRKVVDEPFEKAIKPSTVGRDTAGKRAKFKEDVRESVQAIIDNKKNLLLEDANGNFVKKLPESIDEASQAISQTKKELFNTWDTLQKQAGGKGIKVKLNRVVEELDNVINNEAIKLSDPDVVVFAQALKDRFFKAGEITPKVADQIIASFNAKLKAFNRNPNLADVSKHTVNNGVVVKLRQSLDETVSNAVGKKFQPLKTKYGALSSIEKDVGKAAAREAKSVSGKMSAFMDAFSIGDMARGVVSLRPGLVAKGSAQLALKALFFRRMNPDKAVASLFKNANRLINPQPVFPSFVRDAFRGANLPQAGEVFPTIPGSIRSLTEGQ